MDGVSWEITCIIYLFPKWMPSSFITVKESVFVYVRSRARVWLFSLSEHLEQMDFKHDSVLDTDWAIVKSTKQIGHIQPRVSTGLNRQTFESNELTFESQICALHDGLRS